MSLLGSRFAQKRKPLFYTNRRARVTSKEIPGGQTALEEYQKAYRNYINCRHKNRREDEILARKLVSPMTEQSKEHQGVTSNKKAKVPQAKIYKKGTWKWVNDGWAHLPADGEPWWGMGNLGGPFYATGRQPYKPPVGTEPRIHRRKCGCQRVSKSRIPGALVRIPGTRKLVDGRLINYENRDGDGNRLSCGTKWFLCKHVYNSDSEETESCYPTVNDTMRQEESDTDSDMPDLRGHEDLSPRAQRSEEEDDGLNLEEIRELIETHLILAGGEKCVISDVEPLIGGMERPLNDRLVGLVSERDGLDLRFVSPSEEQVRPAAGGNFPNRFRTGGGGSRFAPDSRPLEEEEGESTGRPVTPPPRSCADDVDSDTEGVVGERERSETEERETGNGTSDQTKGDFDAETTEDSQLGNDEEINQPDEGNSTESDTDEEPKREDYSTTQREQETGATGAAPQEYSGHKTGSQDPLKPTGVLEMRWRSPGSSPERDEDEEVDSPHSLSLSVSEVQTAVFHGLMLGDLLRNSVEEAIKLQPHELKTPKTEVKPEMAKREPKRERVKKGRGSER